LKQHTITFQSSLPQWKLNAIDRLGFGNRDKIILQFDTIFWNDKWTILYLADAPFPFALCNSKKRILSFMIGGRRAQAMEDEKNETTVRQVMDSLKQAFAQQKFKLERYIISR
jgi:lysine-specific histone demethylase 1